MGPRDKVVHILESYVSIIIHVDKMILMSLLRYGVMIAMVFHAVNNGISAYGTFTQSRMILLLSLIFR